MKATNIYLTSILVIALLILIGCVEDSENVIEPGSSTSQIQLLKNENTTGLIDLKLRAEKVAKYLVQNEELVSKDLATEMKQRVISISNLDFINNFESILYDNEGHYYDISLETYNGSILDTNEPLRVAIDPDRFYSGATEFPAFVFNRSKNDIEIEQISMPKTSDTVFPYPLIFVTLEDRTEIPWSEIIENSKIFKEYGLVAPDVSSMDKLLAQSLGVVTRGEGGGGSSTPYLCLTKVLLHIEKDGATKEEFEIYIREETGAARVNSTTVHKFDGGYHTDAAGRWVKYEDVNNKYVTYTMNSPIALWPLTNSFGIGIAPIEDDCTSGEHKNDANNTSSIHTGTLKQEYRRGNGLIYTFVDRDFNITGNCADDDDIYSKGMFSEWTTDNTPTSELIIDLGHVRIWVKKKNF